MNIFKKVKKARENKKGFTLVELIVVLVILAILAAVLVPTLLGWIDKAKEEKIYNNAEAAYVAAQGIADEAYGLGKVAPVLTSDDVNNEIATLTDLEDFEITAYTYAGETGHDAYIIATFNYKEGGTEVQWTKTNGSWTIVEPAEQP